MAAMKQQYGKRGEEVFYRSKNAGTITGVEARLREAGRGLKRAMRRPQRK